VGAGLTRQAEAEEKEFQRLLKEEEKRVNTTRAEEAFNKLRERQLDLTIGEKNGFANKRGGEAINTPLLKDYTQRFADAAKEVEDELANDEQRELYRRRAGVSSLQFREDLLRHIHREGDVHARQVYEGGVTVEVRNATARWQDPASVGLSLERITGLVDQEAARGGWSPEMREAERLKRTTAVHSAVIGQALATDNYIYAQDWYNRNQADIDPATAKAVQKAVEDGTQKQLYAGYTREFLGVQDDIRGLAMLHGRVDADPSLDDTRRNALLGRIQARTGVLEARARVAADKMLDRVKTAIKEARDNLMAGFEPTPEQLAPILNASKGTELEADARALVAGANATRAFRNSTPSAQEVMITRAEAMIRQDPLKFDRRVLESWRQIHENQKRLISESPVAFAVRQGLVDPKTTAAQPLDLSSPAAAAPSITARFELARAMQRAYSAPFKPLTQEEATLAANVLKAATVPQKREWFGAIAQAAGGDHAGYSAIMAQIAPDAPVIAIAGEYAGKGRNQAADLLLRGESILRPNRKEDGTPDGGKLLPLPPEGDMRRAFDDKVRDAYAGMPQARSDHFQAARAIYAAISSDAGDRDTSIIDSKRWDEAIRLATGGVEKYRGRNLVLPYGSDLSTFRDGLNRRLEHLAESGQLDQTWTRSKLLDLPLESAGDGKYVLKVGPADLVGKDGRPIIIDFNVSAPLKLSGHGLKAAVQEPTVGEISEASKPVTGRAMRRKPTVVNQ